MKETKLNNIALIGFSGIGKSTIGKIVADKLALQFVDTDKLIESRLNMTIKRIFAEHGEEYFRQIEKEVIQECSHKNGIVIATGGGAVLNTNNIESLKVNGLVILLKARLDIIYRNVCKDQTRPLLAGSENPMDRINKLLEARAEYYKNNHCEIDVSDMTIEQAADEVIKLYSIMSRKD
jgi:shikimate kinase